MYGKTGNSAENSNGTVHPGGNFPEKINTFRGITFFPFLPRRLRFSVPFVWITSARLHVGRKRNIYWYFVNGTTQSRSCFRYQQKYQYHLTENQFTEISVQMVSAQSGCVGRLGKEGKKEIIARLRVVLHFPSRIVERGKCERASKLPIARKAPFSREVIFTRARVSLAPLSLRENKASTRSLDYCYFYWDNQQEPLWRKDETSLLVK